MRKNIKKIIYLLIAIITLPLNVSALSGKVSIVCDKTIIAPKESTSCRITGSSDGFISGLSLTATNSKNVKTSNWIVASGWQGDATSGIIDLYTDINKSGNFNIASFTLTAVSEGTSALNITGDYSDDNFELSSVSGKLNLTIKKNNSKPNNTVVPNPPISNDNIIEQDSKSSDASLSALEISNHILEFSPNVFEYNLEVEYMVKEISINAEATHAKAEVVIPDDLSLETGENSFEIKVIAENGKEQIYTIKVNKLAKVLSDNNHLSELNIEGYTINFKKNQFLYGVIEVDEDTLNITYETEDKNAKVNIYGNYNISDNDHIIIEVTAENGDIANYIIKVSNISRKINWLLITCEGVLIISLGLNLYCVAKKRKK